MKCSQCGNKMKLENSDEVFWWRCEQCGTAISAGKAVRLSSNSKDDNKDNNNTS